MSYLAHPLLPDAITTLFEWTRGANPWLATAAVFALCYRAGGIIGGGRSDDPKVRHRRRLLRTLVGYVILGGLSSIQAIYFNSRVGIVTPFFFLLSLATLVLALAWPHSLHDKVPD